MNTVPTCPICDARNADYITGTKPWGKSWHCRECDFVYDGSVGERESPETKKQRYRLTETRRAQRREGGEPDAQRQRGIEAIRALRAHLKGES
jgi:transposase-like protein